MENYHKKVEKMSTHITLKIDQDLMDKIKTITQKKHPLRKIDTYAVATREALFEYVEKNRKFLKASI